MKVKVFRLDGSLIGSKTYDGSKSSLDVADEILKAKKLNLSLEEIDIVVE